MNETETDFTTAGAHPLALTRTYWSDLWRQNPTPSRLGGGWSTNFDGGAFYIGGAQSPQNITIAMPGGRVVYFQMDGSVVQETTYNFATGATSNVNGRETLTTDGFGNWFLQSTDDVVYTYNSAGQLASIRYRDGYTQILSWSAAGQNTKVTDSFGRTLTFAYDSNGLLTQVTTPDNTTISYDYINISTMTTNPDLAGLTFQTLPVGLFALQTVTYPDTATTTYQYGNTSFPLALTGKFDERNVEVSTWSWTADGKVAQSAGAGGVENFTFTYGGTNNQTTVTNPANKQTVYSFNPNVATEPVITQIQGEPSANCPLSNSSITYDANTFINQITDAEGRVTTYTNEARGLPTSITRGYGSPSAVTTTTTWNPTWRVPNEVVQPGLTTDYSWNTTGQLTSVTQTDTTAQTVPYSTNGQTRTWSFGYTGVNLTSVTGPVAGQTTSYGYDSNGYVRTITDASAQVTTVNSVNGRGEPTSVTDAKGVITALAYDLRGRLTSVSVDTANNPATTSITYTPAGDVATITDPIGAVQTFTYDDARRLTTVINSAGETVTYTRDAMGNATSVVVTNSSNATTYSKSRTFDELGRLIQSVGAVSATSSYLYGYDRTDNLTSVTDPRSYTFAYGFDALNRLITETDEENAVVTLTRNGIDAITAYQDPRSITTTYVRNGFGEIIQEASPDKGTTIYYRDGNGNVTQRSDPRGSVPSIADLAINDQRTFDTKGNVTAYSRSISTVPPFASNYTYDADGNVTSLTYPSGRVVTFQRDALGRISGVTTRPSSPAASQTLASSVSWLPYSGIASLTFGNGIVQTFTRDTDDRITAVVATTPASANVINRTLSWTGETLDSITDNQFPGNTPPFTYNAQSQSFTYTPTHRLSGATGYYGNLAWTYDATGNRTQETTNGVASTYAYPTSSNQLMSITPPAGGGTARTFTYDAAGDIVGDSRAAGPAMTFVYDAEGRLAEAYPTSTPANVATYAYDPQSRLAARTVTQSGTTTTTYYAYDTTNHIIAELNGSGQTLREYVWLDDMPLAVVDNVATAPVIYYVQVDHLARPARMTDANTNWVWDVIFDPFGATASINQNPATMDIRFPGQWFQLETGLAYNWHRHYDATTGRYVQPDPLIVDEGRGASVSGLRSGLDGRMGPSKLNNAHATADAMGWRSAVDIVKYRASDQPIFRDGPNAYGYAQINPLVVIDASGLAPQDKRFGLPDLFWRWYHRCIKQPGDPDLNYEDACYWHSEWCKLGKPKV